MRVPGTLAVVLLALAGAAAGQPRAEPARYGYVLGDRVTDAVVISRYTAERADTIEAVLAERGVQVTPLALSLVAELNPALDLRHPLAAHRALVLPAARIAPSSPEDLAFLDPALAARRAGRLLAAFDRVGIEPDALDADGRAVLAAFAQRFRERVVGLEPDAVADWTRHGEGILALAGEADAAWREGALELARDAGAMLEAAVPGSDAIDPLLEFDALRITATDPPGGALPAQCRLRVALRSHAYRGHVVPEAHVADAAVSDCAKGTALLRRGLPYAVWAEWPSGERVLRSRMQAIAPSLDGHEALVLPLQPFD
jgi:hypothetical protein